MSGYLSSSPPAAPSLEDTRGIPTYTSDSEDEDTVSPSKKDTEEIRAPTIVSPSNNLKAVRHQIGLMSRIGDEIYELQEEPHRQGNTPPGQTYFKYVPFLTRRRTKHGLALSPHMHLSGIVNSNQNNQQRPDTAKKDSNPYSRKNVGRKRTGSQFKKVLKDIINRGTASGIIPSSKKYKRKSNKNNKTKKKRRTRRTSKRKRKPIKKSTKH